MSQVFFAVDDSTAKKLSKQYREGKLRKIYRGVYTNNLDGPLELVVRRNWMKIVAYIVPMGALSYRTAFELRPVNVSVSQAMIFITSTYVKTIILPGFIIKVLKGDNKAYVDQVLPNLAKTNTIRTILENLSPSRLSKYKGQKTIGKAGVEIYLAKELRLRKEQRLNTIRDEAKDIAQKLGLQAEFKLLNNIIIALLSTHSDSKYLSSTYAIAIVKKEPYDIARIQSFESLADYLLGCRFIDRPYEYDKSTNSNMAFFESYFSNFIEGTEFKVSEAEQIIFNREEIYERHEDSHDLLSHYIISSDSIEMARTPRDATELIELLQDRHAYLLKERPKLSPGTFKEVANRAGSTYFVEPEDVVGTLVRGFEIYRTLPDGMPKAIFMHFLISEVHPFNDGNGRMARIMMNAELFSASKYRIIMPNVYRDGYIGSLRQASKDGILRTICKVMDVCQAYTASIPWYSHNQAKEKLENDYTFELPETGLMHFNAVIRALKLSRLLY